MYSEQQTNKNTQMKKNLDVTSEKVTSFEEGTFSQEQITFFDCTPLDEQQFVTIEYDGSDYQPDPLAVDGTCVVPKTMNNDNQQSSVKISHPFLHHVEELTEPYLSMSNPGLSLSPDSLSSYSPPKISHSEKLGDSQSSEQREVIVISDDDESGNQAILDCEFRESVASKRRRRRESVSDKGNTAAKNNVNPERQCSLDSPALRQKTGQCKIAETQPKPDQSIMNKSSLTDPTHRQNQVGDVNVGSDPSDSLMKELSKQMLQKIEEKKRAASELSRKKGALMTFARQLVRQITSPGIQQVPCSVNSSVRPCNPGSTADGAVNQKFDQMTTKQRNSAETALARRLLQQMSKGFSLEQALPELLSHVSSNVETGDYVNRESPANVIGKPTATTPATVPHSPMETPFEPTKMGLEWQEPYRNSQTALLPETSSSTTGAFQVPLPSYSLTFDKQNRGCRSSAQTSRVGQPIQRDDVLPVKNFQPRLPPAARLPHPFPTKQPPQIDSESFTCCSPLSAVHVSHLLPPTDLHATVGQSIVTEGSMQTNSDIPQSIPSHYLDSSNISSSSTQHQRSCYWTDTGIACNPLEPFASFDTAHFETAEVDEFSNNNIWK